MGDPPRAAVVTCLEYGNIIASVMDGPNPALIDGNKTPVTGEVEVFSKVIVI